MFATHLWVRARLVRALGWAVAAATSAGTVASNAHADLIFGFTTEGELLTWDSANPQSVLSSIQVAGLASGDRIAGADVRPSDGELYALGKSGRIYHVNITTGQAMEVGAGSQHHSIGGGFFGFDFDFAAGDAHASSNANKNAVLNPGTGDIQSTGGKFFFGDGDSLDGRHPSVTFLAFAPPGAEQSSQHSLYGLETIHNVLVSIDQATGELRTIGAVGFKFQKSGGFDIAVTDGVAYAALSSPGPAGSAFYQIDLSTGAATSLGAIGEGRTIVGMAVAVPGPSALLAIACGLFVFFSRRRRALQHVTKQSWIAAT